MARSPLGPPITTDPPREPQPLRCKPYAVAFYVVGATAVLVVAALSIAAAIVGDPMDDAERLRDMGNAILWAHEDGATLARVNRQRAKLSAQIGLDPDDRSLAVLDPLDGTEKNA